MPTTRSQLSEPSTTKFASKPTTAARSSAKSSSSKSSTSKPSTSEPSTSKPDASSPRTSHRPNSKGPTPTASTKPDPKALSEITSTYLETPGPFLASYPVTVNEIGVLTVEPYKSTLLPEWRFRTADVAASSAASLEKRFHAYGVAGDFVGMDMARKFIQMGMTRARRYANRPGGRKYAPDGHELPVSKDHEGRDEKDKASNVFREVWERCKVDPEYLRLKDEFLGERKAWKAESEKG